MAESTPRLGIYGLTYEYGGVRVLDEVSFEVRPGEILSMLGPNGSGKSTLMKAAAGILPLDRKGCSGQIRYQGTDVQGESLGWRARRIAYVSADIRAEFPMTAEQTVMLGRSSQGGGLLRLSTAEDREAVESSMRRCFCWGLRDRDLHTLSGGEKQLVALARAMAQGAKVLFLDEALSRMDLHHQASVGHLMMDLASQGYSIVLVSHDINIASEWASTGLLLKRGKRIGYGPIREILTEQNIRELYPSSDLLVANSPVSGAPKVFFKKP